MARGTRTMAVGIEAQAPISPTAELDAEAGLLALQKHVNTATDATLAIAIASASQAALPTSAQSNVYSPAAVGSQQPPVAAVYPDPEEAQIHPDLRSAQLLALQQSEESSPSEYPPVPVSINGNMSAVPQPQQAPSVQGTALPQNAPPPLTMQADGTPTDGRRGPRRELSQSKRAAQNRAAQRAFRQRKEGYIKKLEQQVTDFNTLDAQCKAYQGENFALREYILQLQSKLLDAKAEIPLPPPQLHVSVPGVNTAVSALASAAAAAAAMASQAQAQAQAQAAVSELRDAKQQEDKSVGVMSSEPLDMVAQAVAQLDSNGAASNGKMEKLDDKDLKPDENAMDETADEIDRQLQSGESAYPAPVATV